MNTGTLKENLDIARSAWEFAVNQTQQEQQGTGTASRFVHETNIPVDTLADYALLAWAKRFLLTGKEENHDDTIITPDQI